MIFQRHEKENKLNVFAKLWKTVTCSKPILLISSLTEEANKVGFTQKGSTENYLCIFQVNWIFKALNKA